MKLIKHYRHDAALRQSFNALAEATFGLNFENWYQNGFWGDNYDPYSIWEDGKVVANVSLNRTDMAIDGQTRRLYQLGTVMTDPAYRNRGYIRILMAEIGKDITDADGVYLFANDGVLEFYPKFGFVPGKEHFFTKSVQQDGPCRMKNVPMRTSEDWNKLKHAMEKSTFRSACAMVNNPGLIFFYVSQFMQDCVYHDETLNAWVIAEVEDVELLIHNVFAPAEVSLDSVIQAFGSEIRTAALGFTPVDPDGFVCQEYREEDCTFFIKGNGFRDFADRKLRIPSLSHA